MSTRYVWAWVGAGKRGHAFALAENGAVRNPLYAVCGVGPGYDFDPAHDPCPHCKRCERLVPILAHVQNVFLVSDTTPPQVPPKVGP